MDEFYSQCRTCLDHLKPGMEFIDLFDERMLYSVINESVPNILVWLSDNFSAFSEWYLNKFSLF